MPFNMPAAQYQPSSYLYYKEETLAYFMSYFQPSCLDSIEKYRTQEAYQQGLATILFGAPTPGHKESNREKVDHFHFAFRLLYRLSEALPSISASGEKGLIFGDAWRTLLSWIEQHLTDPKTDPRTDPKHAELRTALYATQNQLTWQLCLYSFKLFYPDINLTPKTTGLSTEHILEVVPTLIKAYMEASDAYISHPAHTMGHTQKARLKRQRILLSINRRLEEIKHTPPVQPKRNLTPLAQEAHPPIHQTFLSTDAQPALLTQQSETKVPLTDCECACHQSPLDRAPRVRKSSGVTETEEEEANAALDDLNQTLDEEPKSDTSSPKTENITPEFNARQLDSFSAVLTYTVGYFGSCPYLIPANSMQSMKKPTLPPITSPVKANPWACSDADRAALKDALVRGQSLRR